MDIIQSVILGLIEGITEFLPISSTGHLIVVSSWLGLPQNDANKAFEVIIQLAAILAVLTLYKDRFTLQHTKMWSKIILAFLPIAAIGFIFRHQVKALFSVPVVSIMFIVGGIAFIVLERVLKEREPVTTTLENVSYRQAAWIGIAQVFALVPGTSRAGSTIFGSLLVGVDRKVSAEFSFLLALPVMLAASGYDLIKHYSDFSGEHALPLVLGFIVAYLCAWVVMKALLAFLNRFTFNAFGIYRIIFGIGLLTWFYLV